MNSEVSEGITKGLLSYGEDKIRELVNFFNSKKLKFIGDKQTIEVAKETKKSGEWAFYRNYVEDKELLFIIKLGLVLRKIEKDTQRLENLKDKIVRNYKVQGLHIAYFVQNGILNRYVGILLDDLDSSRNLSKIISHVLNNIEKHALFINRHHDKSSLLKESMTITSAHKPEIFIISGIGLSAKLVKDNEGELTEALRIYELEKISTGKKEILFFKFSLDKNFEE